MKRKRSADDDTAVINEIIKRVKLCFDRKRKRDDEEDDDFALLSLSCKRMKLSEDTDSSLRQRRRDILVYL